MVEYIPLLLFALVFVLILIGYPVALTLGGISVIAGIIFFDIDFFYLLSLRIYGIMNNFVLLAVPLFIFMGITLEKSGIAEKLLETMALMFGRIKGGVSNFSYCSWSDVSCFNRYSWSNSSNYGLN